MEQDTATSTNADHIEMARCSSKDSVRYRHICRSLKQFISTRLSSRETNSAVKYNWLSDKTNRLLLHARKVLGFITEEREVTLDRAEADNTLWYLVLVSSLGLVLERQGRYEEAEAMH